MQAPEHSQLVNVKQFCMSECNVKNSGIQLTLYMLSGKWVHIAQNQSLFNHIVTDISNRCILVTYQRIVLSSTSVKYRCKLTSLDSMSVLVKYLFLTNFAFH